MRQPDPGGYPTVPTATYAAAITYNSAQSTGTRSAARQTRVALQNQAAVKDASGTALTTPDEGGFGLNRPYLAWNSYPTSQEAAPPASTTSGTFGALWTVSAEPQHPKVRVRVLVVAGAATTGEVRLVDRATGQVISSILSAGAGVTEANLDGTLVAPSLAGAGAPMKVDVQARRTGGVNTVAVLLLHAVGKGT